jgi:hypothetical protein
MNKRNILTAILLLIAVFCYSQSEKQKEIIFEYINKDSKGTGKIVSKINSVENKEAIFSNAKVFPVFKIKFNNENKPFLEQNNESYLVYYEERLYVFYNGEKSRLFENSPIIETISKSLQKKDDFLVVYFNDNFSSYGDFINPLVTDKEFSYLIDKEERHDNLMSYVNLKFGSLEKYKEKAKLDDARKEIVAKEVDSLIKDNYLFYENYCPKDTVLIINSFINQVRHATNTLEKNQEIELRKRISAKINPYNYFFKDNLNDSTKTKIIAQLKKENMEAKKKMLNLYGKYDFLLLGSNITNELLEVLTEKQFIDYKNYIDIVYPTIETSNFFKPSRYNFSITLLENEKKINQNDNGSFNAYVKKLLSNCGCK